MWYADTLADTRDAVFQLDFVCKAFAETLKELTQSVRQEISMQRGASLADRHAWLYSSDGLSDRRM